MSRHKESVIDHVKKGTYRPKRHANAALEQTALGFELLREAPPPPESIASCKLAVDMWETIVPTLARTGRLAPEDLQLLEQIFLQVGILEVYNEYLTQTDGDPATLIKIADARMRLIRPIAEMLSKFGVTSYGRQQLAATLVAVNQKRQKRAVDDLIEGADEGD